MKATKKISAIKKVSYSIISCFLLSSSFAQTKDITLTLLGFKSNQGECIISLFNSKNGYPEETTKCYRMMSSKIVEGKCTILIKDLTTGEYAISVIHDENSNGKMDTNFFGIPKEGSGASNNPKSSDGPPTFTDSKFKYTGASQTMSITIKYL